MTVASKDGLHSRPASLFAKAAADSGHRVALARNGGGTTANGASVLSVLALAAKRGERLRLTVTEGEEAERVADELAALLETDHD